MYFAEQQQTNPCEHLTADILHSHFLRPCSHIGDGDAKSMRSSHCNRWAVGCANALRSPQPFQCWLGENVRLLCKRASCTFFSRCVLHSMRSWHRCEEVPLICTGMFPGQTPPGKKRATYRTCINIA